jgi:hypothetical protein
MENSIENVVPNEARELIEKLHDCLRSTEQFIEHLNDGRMQPEWFIEKAISRLGCLQDKQRFMRFVDIVFDDMSARFEEIKREMKVKYILEEQKK